MRSAVLRATSALLLCGMAGCGDTSAPDLNPVDYLLAEADGSWSNTAASFLSLSYTPTPPTRVAAGDCVYNSTTHFFTCPQRTSAGTTFDFSYELLDAANVPLPAYDASAVAAIRTITDVNGTVTGSSSIDTITSHGDRIMTGILSGNRLVNGTESSRFARGVGYRTFGTSTYMESTIANLTVPPRNSPTYPSGVLSTKYYSSAPAPGAVPDMVFTMTYDGSQFATLVLSSASLVQTCTFDLKGIAQPVCTS